MINIRQPAFAGQFYPKDPEELKNIIKSLIGAKTQITNAAGCILPHAGYIYSGGVAAKTVSKIKIRKRILLLGPNHTGLGAAFSLMSEGSWKTPLGEVKIDSLFAKKLLAHCPSIKEDASAHVREHSLEVELPFLQFLSDDFMIVPLVVGEQNFDKLVSLGKEIAEIIRETKEESSTLIIASSDMTHFEPRESAELKDKLAIEAILDLDAALLAKRVQEHDISMCGVAPVIVMLTTVSVLGSRKAKLIEYTDSAANTKDTSSVVAYAGVIIK